MLLRHYLEQGTSKSALARRLGVHRDTIHRWIREGELDRDLDGEPVRYGPRRAVATKLDAYKAIIETRLAAYPQLSAVRLLAEIRGLKRATALPEIERWLERVDLAGRGKSKVEELSKGMQQKVQLIGTVLHKPDLLILDEPFSGLDPINQELFRELLGEYRAQGKSVVLSTHGMELAERMCDHICLISHGRAVLDGELKQIKRQVSGNSYRLVATGDLERLKELPEVETAAVHEGMAKLLLRPDASAISTSALASPPRVRSRRQCISIPASSSAEMTPFSGAQSLSMAESNSNPSRTAIMAMPCRPMSPLRSTASPGRTPCCDLG